MLIEKQLKAPGTLDRAVIIIMNYSNYSSRVC